VSGEDDDNVDEEKSSVELVSMLSTVLGDFTQTWTTAADLNAATVTNSWQVLVTVGLLCVLLVSAVSWGHFADDNDAKEISVSSSNLHKKVALSRFSTVSKNTSSVSKMASIFSNSKVVQNRRERRISSVVSEEVQMIDNSLPAALASKPFYQKFIEENQKNHRWLGVVFYFSPHFSRMLRVLSLGTNIVVMLFLQAVVSCGL
jgi:hypothetical protein